MRTIDLAVYADRLAGERVLLSARLDRCRARLCEVAIEREASAALDSGTVALLRVAGLLSRGEDALRVRAEMAEISAAIAALEQLQAWVERRLAVAQSAEVATARPESVTTAPSADAAAPAVGVAPSPTFRRPRPPPGRLAP